LFTLHAYASGVEVLRYYGLGNDTANNGDNDFYKAEANQILLFPALAWPLDKSKRTAIGIGPVLRYSQNDEGQNTFIETDQPFGFPEFGQVGIRSIFAHDSRDNRQFPRKGAFVGVRGTYWPAVWDAQSSFGEVDANANVYVGGKFATLAVRAGGKRVFGDYPYFDAAYVGGGGLLTGALAEPGFTVRGFRARRFGGDGSLYGNTDLRLRLGQITLLVPTHVGVFGLFDVGRVFYKGESSDTWHTSYGGGIWFSLLNYRNTFSAYLAHSKEDNIFHVGGGFTF
jgi:outer membrane protein assembly factor BamA